MKKIILIFLLFFNNLHASSFTLKKVINDLKSPWSLSFIDDTKLLITEKSGNIKLLNLKKNLVTDIKHNLNILEDGQGGLLDILYLNKIVFVSYSENRSNGMSSTSVARANFSNENLNFKNIFRAEPPINSGYHFGSRLVSKDNYLFITVGERRQGMIAQDFTQHPGS